MVRFPLRDADTAPASRVTTLELFFDLVFVFTITQLTGLLERDLSAAGAARVFLVFGVLWWMYGGYAWMTNQVPPRLPARQLLLLVGMAGGEPRMLHGSDYVATIPLRELVGAMRPSAPAPVRAAAAALEYRDYLTLVLIVNRAEVFPDNWIYIHEPDVLLGRIQNYKNWSPKMVPDQRQTALGLEYFTTEGDLGLWEMGDDELIQLGIRESTHIGLVNPGEVVDGTVVRMPKAYPVYDEHYATNVAVIRDWLRSATKNLQTVGRNGMHKYNNQDHSMMAALLAARNILGEDWDPWQVNTDAEYHEELRPDADQAGRRIPGHAAPVPPRR
ncbi:MAG: low temperature requirement protein A [Actinomycetota bacterium]|nr:low temperature requirement protein A [Actinomycetota bacterium]